MVVYTDVLGKEYMTGSLSMVSMVRDEVMCRLGSLGGEKAR